ncbi:Methyltransferase domain-containing protein [Monaibacterium marinum]|uniref:N-acetylmuramoyl-L-alanine amidase n=1 Tax=Pontivivens marinum TaxID=1690039 RepID=A0A2C9CMG9_9RHOB|nr:Methyltransferase domain-containing protein [Monaibacterium marinum]
MGRGELSLDITQRASPNYGDRRGHVPSLIVLHYTAMDSAEAAICRLCEEEHQVSAHYVIGRDGDVTQLVPEDQRAWHAGAGAWGDITDVNSHSIGVELDNDGFSAFPDVQMRALDGLLRAMRRRWDIPKQNVIGHSDLAPGRKSDPGALFDWGRLAAQGHAILVPEGVAAPGDFRAAARAAGWTAVADDDVLLDAVRLRHRPAARGLPLDGRDMFIVRWLGDLAVRRGPEDILATYERQAVSFDARRRRGMEEDWLSRFAALMPDGPVLDLGCGAGQPIADWFMRRGRSVTGVDGAAAMLALAQQRMPDQDWVQADMRGLDLGRKFAGIIAWNSFFHLKPTDQAAMFPVFRAQAQSGAPLMFTCGPSAGEVWGQVGGEDVYHASLATDHYARLLDENGFDLLDFVIEDPTCGGHTICLARRR